LNLDVVDSCIYNMRLCLSTATRRPELSDVTGIHCIVVQAP